MITVNIRTADLTVALNQQLAFVRINSRSMFSMMDYSFIAPLIPSSLTGLASCYVPPYTCTLLDLPHEHGIHLQV
jgi:hypothetical protein